MKHREALEIMFRSRFFEEKLQKEFSLGNLYGTTHLAIGQEASHTGLVMALDKKDWIVPTHRCHGFNIARGSDMAAMFSEMLGSCHGLCKGLGGSMHMTDVSTFDLGSSAVVGSGVPLAGGAAYALKRQGKNNIAVAIFGDGASSRGSVHEMMNLASVWNLPLLFFMENNHYGMSASTDRVISTSSIHSRAEGYSMAHGKVDGNDVEKVFDAVEEARKYIAGTGRPYFLEVDTYRLCGHSKSDKLLYRTREEENEWKKKDPILLFSSSLLERALLTEEEIEETREKAESDVENAWNKAWEKRGDVLSLQEAEALVLPEGEKTEYNRGRESHRGTYREAVREALGEIFSSDERVTLMGEDIGVYGGCFGVTGDLWKEWGGRMYETPVSEEAFSGLAAGAAMLGERPIVEIMYADFMTLASDAIINHAAKTYFMSGGQLRCPMVVRTAMGGGTGHGAQHTACPESMFLNVPGIKVCAPSDPWSAKALLKAAVKEECPVVFFEHKALYLAEGEIGDEEAILPLGRALVEEKGDDLLVIGYSRAIYEAKKALSDYSATFMDLATIKPLDKESILRWAGKIDKILLVENVPIQSSVAESVIRILFENGMKNTLRTVSALEMPLAFSRTLENAALPNRERIREAADALLEEKG
ncbi:MAG: thiamine pyrophosphate-dependent enzyme [Candidatus Ornithospirochaeta sp.]